VPEIVLTNVNKRYAGTSAAAVKDLDLTIPDGSFTTFLGPSGCGKTTTLRMIAGLEAPTGGEIAIGGHTVYSFEKGVSLAPSKRGLGLVFQSYALWPHLTVFENIAFGLQVKRLARTEVADSVDEVAGALQIGEYLERYTSELSGGQQQRVAIARVLVMRPKVLLLDEPLSNLDAKLRMDMRAELKRLHAETGATVIYVTHDQLEALTMSTHIAMMKDGELQQFAPPLELYAQPANLFAADFLGNPRINLLPGVTTGEGVACGDLVVAAPRLRAGEMVTVGLRAEELRLAREAGAGRASAEIVSVLPTGADWYYRLAMPLAGEQHIVTVRATEAVGLREGDQVWLEAAPVSVKVFDAAGRSLTAATGAQTRARGPEQTGAMA
jgi:ABC-type sugar transport system ATPase subunit